MVLYSVFYFFGVFNSLWCGISATLAFLATFLFTSLRSVLIIWKAKHECRESKKTYSQTSQNGL